MKEIFVKITSINQTPVYYETQVGSRLHSIFIKWYLFDWLIDWLIDWLVFNANFSIDLICFTLR